MPNDASFATAKTADLPLKFIDCRSTGKFPNEDLRKIAREYTQTLQAVGMLPSTFRFEDRHMKIAIVRLQRHGSDSKTHDEVSKALESTREKLGLQNDGASKAPIIFVMLDSNDAKMFAAVKRYAGCQMGWQTICVTKDKSNKLYQSTRTYLALKHNVKLGGINHIV